MYHCRPRRIFHRRQNRCHLFNGITVRHIVIIKSQSLKHIALCLAVRFAQQTQIRIQTAVILGNRHLIVINNNNDIAA